MDLTKKGERSNMLKKLFTISVVVLTITWAMGLAALAPVASAADAGDLIKMEGLSTVYYLGSDAGTLKRYVFPNASTFGSWYGDFSGVITISQSELQSYPLSGVNVTLMPGMYLAKITTDPKVYAISGGGQLHWVPTEELAVELYGAGWASLVRDLPDEFFGNYDLGTELAAAADYDKDAEKAAATNISADLSLDEVVDGGDTGGALTISLASDSPAGTAIPQSAANVVFARINISAGANAATITGLKATKYGLGSNANVNTAKLFDGVSQLGSAQSLNSLNQTAFSGFTLTIPANSTKTLDIAVDMASTLLAGHLISFGVNSAADITTTSSVSGSFPMQGAEMSMSTIDIGTIGLYAGGLHPTAGNVEPDATDYRFTQVRITATGEAATLTQITAYKNGTAAASDVFDIKLYNDTTGEALGTVASLDSSGRAVFSGLNVPIAKSGFVELSVLASINGGSGRTIGFDLSDGTAYSIMARGETYGFGITPSALGTGCFAAATTACPNFTILQGKLQINKSASTPPTGYIAQGGTQEPIAAWDFVVTGEPIQVTALDVSLSVTTSTDFTSCQLYQGESSAAGPLDLPTSELLAFGDSMTFPVGTTLLTLKCNIDTSATAGETAVGQLLLATSGKTSVVTARGVNSGKTLTATEILTGSDVAGNAQAIQGPALKVTTLATPIVDSVVVNAQNVEFAHFEFNATSGGEDIRVTQVTVTDTLGGAAAYANLANLEFWGDPDNTDAEVVNDMIPTSAATSTNANTVAFTFQSPIKVSKIQASVFTLKGDVVAGSGTHTYDIDSDNVAAYGWGTGNDITPTYDGTGQAQTIQTTGTLRIDRASDYPEAAQLVSASTGNELMKYKLTALYEDIAITEIPLFLITANRTNVYKAYVYFDGTLVGDPSGYSFDSSMKSIATIVAGDIIVPKGTGNAKYLTIKVDMGVADAVTSTNSVVVGMGASASQDNTGWGAAAGTYFYDIDATGASSGTTVAAAGINSTGVSTAGQVYGSSTFTAHRGVLTVSLNANSPAGSAPPGASLEVLRLDLTAMGDTITVNDMEFVAGGTATLSTGTTSMYKYSGATRTSTTYATWTSVYARFLPGNTFSVSDTTGSGTHGATGSINGLWDVQLDISPGSTITVGIFGDAAAAVATESVSLSLTAPSATPDTTAGIEWEDSSTTNVDSALTKNLPVDGSTLLF